MKNTLLFTFILLSLSTHAQIITTVAGIDSEGYNGDNIMATNAKLYAPYDVALDGKGNFYITDGYNNRIRKVDTAGIITTIAGIGVGGYNGDGIPAITAKLSRPIGITCDNIGNIYFADALNNRVRKIDTSGIITTIAGNGTAGYNGDNISAISAEVNIPHSVARDTHGNLYISDAENHRIRMINTDGVITTIAGTGIANYTGDNGLADTAEIDAPYGIAVDNIDNVYFSDVVENVVRKIDTAGIITTFAGKGILGFGGDNGPADSAKLDNPACIAIDNSNNVYVADIYNSRIRKITAPTGIISTVAGDGVGGFSGDNGLAINAEMFEPTGVAIDSAGNLYIADFANSRIRYIKNTTAINNVNSNDNDLTVYPNPCTEFFTVNITSNINEQVQIIVANVTGQKVKKTEAYTNQPLTIQLDQPSGIYYLSAISMHGITNKIISVVK